jgi:hypothetical protein
MNLSQILALEFRDDTLYKKFAKQATSTHIKEVACKDSQSQ